MRGLLRRRGDAAVERAMFGGVAFLVGGNMAIAASGEGGALVRVDPTQAATLVESGPAVTAVMRGRPMAGWLRVATADLATEDELEFWVRTGAEFAASLPPKAKR